jgi:hypothetical protein
VQPFEREGRAGTVADETLDARPVLALDAHRGVDAEPARALPGEHAGGIELVEESLATEVAEDVLLDDRLHVGDAIGRHVMGLVKLDLAVVGLAEDAVEDDEVVMRVDVEGGAESRVVRSHRRRTGDVAGKSIPGDVPPIVRDFAQGRHSAGVNLGCSPLPP